MDPVANIKEQRSLAEKILEREDREPNAEFTTNQAIDAARLAELVQALDEWRQDGGFDPYMTAEDAIEKVYDAYKPKMMVLLGRIKEVCEEAGLPHDEPGDISGDEYRWSMSVWRSAEARGDGERGNYDKSIQIDVLIAESREYDGEDEYGINFSVDIVESSGRIVGGLTPYNYTNDVWVDARDEEAVSDRWEILEDADVGSIPDLIGEEER